MNQKENNMMKKDKLKEVIYNQDLSKIVYESKKIGASGLVVESEYLSVQDKDLKIARKHFNEIRRETKR